MVAVAQPERCTEGTFVDRQQRWGGGQVRCSDSEHRKFMTVFAAEIGFPTNPSPWHAGI